MKKINLDKDKRLEDIRNLALEIQDTKNKKIGELRLLAESIEILANTKLLKDLNKSIKSVEEGKTISFDEMMKRIRLKRKEESSQ